MEKDFLAEESKKQALDFKETKLRLANAKEAVKQAMEIITGKPYLLQCIFGRQAYAELTHGARQLASLTYPRVPPGLAIFYNGNHDPARGQDRAFWL